jgi:hypothetical protein
MFDVLHAQGQLIKATLFSRAAIPVLALILFTGTNRMSLEIARNIYYSTLVRKIGRKIRATPGVAELAKAPARDGAAARSKRVWVYWDTGFENAPPIVQLCADRLNSFDGVEIVLLENGNLADYVEMPEHIEQKLASGQISRAHYSDLLRLEILYTHGGIWLDATVLLTGNTFPQELLGDELFFYGMSKPSSNGNPIYLSSWAISSPARHPVLAIARKYLFHYWQRHDSLIDYFLFHVTLCATMNIYPELAPKQLGFHNNAGPHLLLLNFHKPYSSDLFDELTSISTIHKLSYKYEEVLAGSMLHRLLDRVDQPAQAATPTVTGT